jgi:hypothetical protein
MADGVHAAVQAMQQPGLHLALHPSRREPQRQQLPERHDAVLRSGQPRQTWGS